MLQEAGFTTNYNIYIQVMSVVLITFVIFAHCNGDRNSGIKRNCIYCCVNFPYKLFVLIPRRAEEKRKKVLSYPNAVNAFNHGKFHYVNAPTPKQWTSNRLTLMCNSYSH